MIDFVYFFHLKAIDECETQAYGLLEGPTMPLNEKQIESAVDDFNRGWCGIFLIFISLHFLIAICIIIGLAEGLLCINYNK